MACLIGAALFHATSMAEEPQAPFAPNPFFAFKNSMDTDGPSGIAEQVRILKDIGFDGFDNRNLEDLKEYLEALDKAGLTLFTSYFTVRIDPGEEPYSPDLPAALELLKNRGTILWCNTHSKRFKPSDTAGDDFAVPLFRALADKAAPYGVRVAPYPHINMWVESPEDTARLAEKVDRPNFGTSFNLFHWKALGQKARPLEEVVRTCGPRLMVLSLNGPHGPHNIGPLEMDGLDEYQQVLGAFRGAGFRGPVGLQCYRVPGDPREHLAQSMAVWKELQKRCHQSEDRKIPR